MTDIPVILDDRLLDDVVVMVPGRANLPNDGRDLTLAQLLAVPGAAAITNVGKGKS